MTPNFGLRSVRHKLFAGVLVTSLAALLVTGVAMLIYDLRSYHTAQVNDLTTQAELIGRKARACTKRAEREQGEPCDGDPETCRCCTVAGAAIVRGLFHIGQKRHRSLANALRSSSLRVAGSPNSA